MLTLGLFILLIVLGVSLTLNVVLILDPTDSYSKLLEEKISSIGKWIILLENPSKDQVAIVKERVLSIIKD